jgi:hypothetical protein
VGCDSPFFQFPPEIRKINAIESLNMSLRKAIKTPGAFPSGDAARKVMFLALRNLPASRTPSKDGKRRSTGKPKRTINQTNELCLFIGALLVTNNLSKFHKRPASMMLELYFMFGL